MRKDAFVGWLLGCSAVILRAAPAFGQETQAPVAPEPQQAQLASRPAAMAPPAATAPQEQALPAEQAAPTSSADGVQDIVVTAQRRSESLQKTALSIQVIQPTALANAGVTSALDLTKILPSVQIGNSGPAPSVYIRGVGGFSSTALASPAVPFYIDGVYVSRSQSVSSEFYDVDRLEVLKGPQGTLYGRNASGGAINIITARPSFAAVSGRADIEIGNFGDQVFDAALNVPLSSTLALRASGQIVDKGGYTTYNFGDDKHQSARLKLLWKPSSDVDLLLSASYGHIGGIGPANVLLNPLPGGRSAWLDGVSPEGQQLILNTSAPGLVRPAQPGDAYQNLKFWNVSAELNWNLGPVTLTVQPAYRRANMTYVGLFTFDFKNGYGFGNFPDKPETSDQTSLEVRLSGDSGRLKYVVGGYFFNEDQYQRYEIDSGLIQHIGVQSGFGTRSYAAFGQATLGITDHIRLIGGARYTSDRREITDGQTYGINPTVIGGCLPPASTAVICLADTYAGSKTFRNFSWKGGFEADVLEDSLLYATASRGFKAGGFNTQSSDIPGQALSFKPEVLTSYEAGLKNRFLGGKLQLNVEGFYWDYKDHQEPSVNVAANGAIGLSYFNAGKARVYGFNVETVARPWHGGTINGTVEYADSKYTEFTYLTPAAFLNQTGCAVLPTGQIGAVGPVVRIDCSGFEIARTPKWSASGGLAQEFAVGDSTVVATANVTYASSRWLSIEFVPLERADPYAMVDLSLAYRAPGSRWSVTGFVRNVNNGKSYTFATASPFSAEIVSNIGAPRTYGVRLSGKF